MGLFRWRQPASFAPDVTLGDELAARLRRGLGQGEWRATRDAILAATDWDYREFLITVITDVPGWPRWIDEWCAAEPDGALPLTVRGAHEVVWAWEARGHEAASAVSTDAMRTFRQRLAQAEADLARATQLDPADPTPWVYALISARGLELGQDEFRARFGEVVSRHPQSRYAHNHLLQGLTAKWGGSHDLMFDFARSSSAKAEEGSGLHALIAEAHIERWVYFSMEDDPDGAGQYWARPDVQAELLEAAGRSVFSPRLRVYCRTPWDRNLFAFAFWKTGQRDQARRLFQVIGRTNSDHPWCYLGDAAAAFARARSESR